MNELEREISELLNKIPKADVRRCRFETWNEYHLLDTDTKFVRLTDVELFVNEFLKRWLADRKTIEAELDEQANWIADNHRLISTLNEDRNNNLEKIKALEAENERLKFNRNVKGWANAFDKGFKEGQKSSLTREDAEAKQG